MTDATYGQGNGYSAYQPPQGQYAAAAMPGMAVQQTVINVGNRKSVGGAVALALLFGPLGMLYATVPGAIVMFFVNLIVGIPTFGVGLLLTVPLGAVWAGVAASSHNNSLGGFSQQVAMQPQPAHFQPQQPQPRPQVPAGWHTDPMGTGQLRYWDGASWTDHYAALPAGH